MPGRILLSCVLLGGLAPPVGDIRCAHADCEGTVSDQAASIDDLLRAIRDDRLTEGELQAVLPKLSAWYRRNGGNAILKAIIRVRKRNSKSVDDVLPVFDQMVRGSARDADVCDVLDMFLAFDELPADVELAVASRFSDAPSDEFLVRAKAAAVLLKHWPEKYRAREWLEAGLSDAMKEMRVAAAMALHASGAAAASAPLLKGLLEDDSAAVRVAAAVALWGTTDAEADRDLLVSTLLESLTVPDQMFTLRSFGMSEWRPGHRYYAADFLVRTRCRQAVVARGLANLLNDADDALRCLALRCLARIDDRDDDVLQAIRRSVNDSVPSVASQAELTLRELTE